MPRGHKSKPALKYDSVKLDLRDREILRELAHIHVVTNKVILSAAVALMAQTPSERRREAIREARDRDLQPAA